IPMADNKHIHYQLLSAGFSHRQTVIIIYGFSSIFGILAIVFSEASFMVSAIVTLFAIFLIHILAELAGVVLGGKRPIVDSILKVLHIRSRDKENMKE